MADRKFTLFHLNLIPIKQYDLETQSNLSREDWLRLTLAEPLEFPHHGGKQLHWVPKGQAEDDSILGILQMRRDHAHHQAPEEGGDEVISEEWQGAYVLLDPTHHQEGQRAAVENDIVGKPYALLSSLVRSINNRVDKPYEIYVSQIFEDNEFWDFAERSGNVLKSISFEFIVPNMFNVDGDFEEDIKETGVDTNAEKIRWSLIGQNGILAISERVKKAVAYIKSHAGTIKATSLDDEKYSSNEQEKTTKIDKVDVDQETNIRYLASNSSAVLGYENSEKDEPLDLASGVDGEFDVD